MQSADAKTVSFNEAFRFWLKLGFISFGDPAGQIAVMQRELVENKRWIDQGFMTGWNNSTFANQTTSAIISGLLTTYATFLPSFLFIFARAPYIERLRHNQKLNAALSGVTAAVVGVILNLALAFGATVIVLNSQIDVFALGLSVLFFALYFFKVDVLIVVIDGGLCGLIKYFLL